MKKHNIVEVLQEDVEIPVIVQMKADSAFIKIHKEAERKNTSGTKERKEKTEIRKIPKKKLAMMLAAAILTFATITVTAAYFKWSKSLSEGLQLTEEQKVEMEESSMVTFVDQKCVDNGITITAVQSITVNYFTHIAFKVEGYDLGDEMEPCFETIKITVDNKDDFNYNASFYNGLIQDNNGRVAYADGTPIDMKNNEIIEKYTMEDGSLEYHVTLFHGEQKDYFMNKPIHVEIKNMGTVAKAAYSNEINGKWIFDWKLQGCGDMKEFQMDKQIGETDIKVVRAEISPISLLVEYDFPRREIKRGEELSPASEPPQLSGVKLKDGTSYPFLYRGPGGSGYLSEESNIYRVTFAIDKMIDVNQVESLLFFKSLPKDGEEYTEDNFYSIPIR